MFIILNSYLIVYFSNKCSHCGVKFGEYHCEICNLWMSANEAPYHCKDCGFCRVGGRDQYRHCHQCGMCIDVDVFDDHNCQSGKYMANCPVCYEDLFSSRNLAHVRSKTDVCIFLYSRKSFNFFLFTVCVLISTGNALRT